MLSQDLVNLMEREVVGQPRALGALVRAATFSLSGIPVQQGIQGPFMFVGPSGTGKTHVTRTLARALHGDERNLVVIDCVQLPRGEEWAGLLRRVAPRFSVPPGDPDAKDLRMAKSSILLVERLEWCPPDFARGLIWAVKDGFLHLPEGKRGWLQGTLMVLTSNLCSREILETGAQGIGFSAASPDHEENERARIFQVCRSALERHWGPDALGCLEDLIVFQRLRSEQLPAVLDLLVLELNRQLARLDSTVVLEESAQEFVVRRGGLNLHSGAWWLVRAFRRFVGFPVADLVGSGRVPRGSRISIGYEAEENRLLVDVAPWIEGRVEADRLRTDPRAVM